MKDLAHFALPCLPTGRFATSASKLAPQRTPSSAENAEKDIGDSAHLGIGGESE